MIIKQYKLTDFIVVLEGNDQITTLFLNSEEDALKESEDWKRFGCQIGIYKLHKIVKSLPDSQTEYHI